MSTQRLRDPIHDLIVFDENDEIEKLAWELVQTKEFQRLRRIRQLGLSEFVFPGATHSRLAHSIGVFNNARRLLKVLEKCGETIESDQRLVVLLSALLHDIGHGPFSHAFENAREAIARKRGEEAILKHEKWSARLIVSEDGGIAGKLGTANAKKIAHLISADDPTDIFHAVVSSSFDADRLDYILRDRYMTGAKAGSIDVEWLIDNLTTHKIQVRQDDDEPRTIPTFVFKAKGRQAAEDFLLARYRLYSQVYLHKTTRGFELLLTALLRHIGDESTSLSGLGLDSGEPLVSFLRAMEIESEPEKLHSKTRDFLRLDDMVIWASIEKISNCQDQYAREIADRLLWRKPLKVFDVSAKYIQENSADGLINAQSRIEAEFKQKMGSTVFLDRAPLNLYSRIGGESAKEHKKVRVLDGSQNAREITDFPDTIISDRLKSKQSLVRFYFLNDADKEIAKKGIQGEVGMNNNSKLVAQIVGASGGRIVGRIRLQKMAYLFQQLGAGSSLAFSYYHYGPYSEELSNAVLSATLVDKLLTEKVEHSDFGRVSIFELPENSFLHSSVGSVSADNAKKLAAKMTAETSVVIELAATVHWLRTKERVANWREELVARKPSKATQFNVGRAENLLNDLGLAA